MKHNLRTANFQLLKPNKDYIVFPNTKVVCSFQNATAVNPFLLCSIELGIDGVVVEKFYLKHWELESGVWDRENLIIHLITHHHEVLAKWDVGYWEDVEPVELPEHFTE